MKKGLTLQPGGKVKFLSGSGLVVVGKNDKKIHFRGKTFCASIRKEVIFGCKARAARHVPGNDGGEGRPRASAPEEGGRIDIYN